KSGNRERGAEWVRRRVRRLKPPLGYGSLKRPRVRLGDLSRQTARVAPPREPPGGRETNTIALCTWARYLSTTINRERDGNTIPDARGGGPSGLPLGRAALAG
ncbi:MAG: hypothetical protein ABI679_16105, partial [Gemmatimonadota bacterium]